MNRRYSIAAATIVLGSIAIAGFFWISPKNAAVSAASSPINQSTSLHQRSGSQRLQKLRDAGQQEPDALIAAMDPSELRDALESLQNTDAGEKRDLELRTLMIRRWVEIDPSAATAWVMAMPAGAAREDAFENIAILRANHDLAEAVAWVKNLPAGPEKESAQFAIANEAVRTRPEEALRLVSELPESAANDELIRRAAMEWTGKNQVDALAWAKEIEDADLRSRVCAGIAIAWSETDPAAAGTFAANDISPGRLQNDLVVSIVQRWAQTAPEEAAAWVADFPPGELRQAAVENLASIWRQSNPERSKEWENEVASRANIR
jgi:hypothetical protein